MDRIKPERVELTVKPHLIFVSQKLPAGKDSYFHKGFLSLYLGRLSLTLLISIFLVLKSPILAADDKRLFFVGELEGYASANQKGMVLDLIKHFDPGVRDQFELRVQPLARAISSSKTELNSHKNCFIGGDQPTAEGIGFNQGRLYSTPFLESRVVIITTKNKGKVKSWQDLEEHAIGILNGNPVLGAVPDNLQKSVTVLSFRSQLYTMLELARLDSGIVFYPFSRNLLEKFHFESEFYLTRYFDTFHCENNEQNQKLLREISDEIVRLVNDGTWTEIFKTYYGNPSLVEPGIQTKTIQYQQGNEITN